MTLAGREMPIPATFYGGTDNSAFQRHLVAGFYTKVDQIAKRNSCVYLRSHSLTATFCILFTNFDSFFKNFSLEYVLRIHYSHKLLSLWIQKWQFLEEALSFAHLSTLSLIKCSEGLS